MGKQSSHRASERGRPSKHMHSSSLRTLNTKALHAGLFYWSLQCNWCGFTQTDFTLLFSKAIKCTEVDLTGCAVGVKNFFHILTFLQTVILQLHLITYADIAHLNFNKLFFSFFLRFAINRPLWLYYTYIECLCMFQDDCPRGHGQAAVTSGTAVMCSVLQVLHAYDGRHTSVPSRGQALHVPPWAATLPPSIHRPAQPHSTPQVNPLKQDQRTEHMVANNSSNLKRGIFRFKEGCRGAEAVITSMKESMNWSIQQLTEKHYIYIQITYK